MHRQRGKSRATPLHLEVLVQSIAVYYSVWSQSIRDFNHHSGDPSSHLCDTFPGAGDKPEQSSQVSVNVSTLVTDAWHRWRYAFWSRFCFDTTSLSIAPHGSDPGWGFVLLGLPKHHDLAENAQLVGQSNVHWSQRRIQQVRLFQKSTNLLKAQVLILYQVHSKPEKKFLLFAQALDSFQRKCPMIIWGKK